MPLNVSAGNHDYHINDSRMVRMLNTDKREALYMGLWDKVVDFFHGGVKARALEEIHMLTHNKSSTVFDVFNSLKKIANDHDKSFFNARISGSNNDMVSLRFGEINVGECSFHSMLNISENIPIPPMDDAECKLAFDLLEAFRNNVLEKKQGLRNIFADDSIPNVNISADVSFEFFTASWQTVIREMESKFGDQIHKLYRPDETRDLPSVSYNKEPSLNINEEELTCLNSGSFSIGSQFGKIGYEKDSNGDVSFRMMHPVINFITNSMNFFESNAFFPADPSEAKEKNANFFQIQCNDYESYNSNKENIDFTLAEIYHTHGNTLKLVDGNNDRNGLLIFSRGTL